MNQKMGYVLNQSDMLLTRYVINLGIHSYTIRFSIYNLEYQHLQYFVQSSAAFVTRS